MGKHDRNRPGLPTPGPPHRHIGRDGHLPHRASFQSGGGRPAGRPGPAAQGLLKEDGGSLKRRKIAEIICEIPYYQYFLTVEELDRSSRVLAREYPSVVRLEEIGRSQEGRPIYALHIGEGPRTAFLFATPHPNEPIGAMLVEFLSQKLAQDREFREWSGFKWVLVKCSDPDGTRLNEGWFRGPFTPLNYARHFYRPPHHQQVEWTFPVHYKTLHFDSPLPETRALMRVIQEEKPLFIYSLHNAGFGGAYFYVTEPCEPLYGPLRAGAVSQGIPLHLGEPEMPYAVKLSDAIYLMPRIQDSYDYLARHSHKDPAEVLRGGTSSADYALSLVPDAFVLVCEVPYFYDPRIEDLNLSDVERRQAVLHSVELSEGMYWFLSQALERIRNHLTVRSRLREAVEEFLRTMPEHLKAKRRWAESAPELSSPATVSQVFDSRQLTRFYGMLLYGMFIRMVEEELSSRSAHPGRGELEEVRDRVEEELLRHNEIFMSQLDLRVIPIRNLVAVQLTAALAVAKYLQSERKGE
ncbi:TPA: hypothetical protein EYH33_02535 [Candidatus Bipolaricaulota bacterium]|nr:hypothetical protein [Candidatus Bipolaricaulota bacterium]